MLGSTDPGSKSTSRWRRRLLQFAAWIVAVPLVVLVVWAAAIGPVEVWRVLTHGTTTVWDHLEYPGRSTSPSPAPEPWPEHPIEEPAVTLDGATMGLDDLLATHDTLAFLVLQDGVLIHEWYAPGHDAATPSMIFSASKSIVSLLVGAAIDDGLIGSVDDSITVYIPELARGGFDAVTIEDLLRMDSGSSYVEDDNPFGIHVEFNYSADLEGDILALTAFDGPGSGFTYRSGDNAIVGLLLDRVLQPESITAYLQRRFLDPIGAEYPGVWSTDVTDGLERTWCCLALTASDLARFGQLAIEGGLWDGQPLIGADWIAASFQPGYSERDWPTEYAGSPLTDYGYQWWLADDAIVALGKDGQYLYLDPTRHVVIVRTGQSQGDISWIGVLRQVAEGL